ncbi:MAG TPA: diadenylate cyclase CdaA, partial [Bacteroidia bacterium]|nr:diadenylate cyclase CdaA [Bacteroidia bacterium]
MDLFQIGFLNIGLIDIIDVLIVAFIIYKIYDLLKGGAAINIFLGIISIYILWWICAKVLNMHLLGTILGQFIGIGVLALVIVFQQEIRRFLIMIGSNAIIGHGKLPTRIIQWIRSNKTSAIRLNTAAIIRACITMSKSKTGALIVITRSSDLSFFEQTGDIMEAEVSKRLIESIFFKNSPLHDGAIIIRDNKIKAARCVLPVTDNQNLPAHLGMRHRAALGIAEQSDAIALIVSEETGHLSIASDASISSNLSSDEFEKMLLN